MKRRVGWNRSWTMCAAVAAVAVALAVAAAGCGGGGGGSPSPSTTGAPVAKKPTATTVPTAAFHGLEGTALKTNELTPSDVTEALAQHRPLAILFYVSGGPDDSAVLKALQNLQPKYSDVTFLLYDYKDPGSYGSLGTSLMVNYPPQVAFIDTQGVIRSVLGGYVDEGTLNQKVVNIRQG